MTKFNYKDTIEYLLKDVPRGFELKNQALEGALAKMTPKEREIVEEAVLKLSSIKGMGRVSSLGVLSAVGMVLSD